MVFMIEKSLIAVMFVYAVSFAMLGVQFILGDVFHTPLTNFQGQPVKNGLITAIHTTTLNTIQTNSTCTTDACRTQVNNPITYLAYAANIAWNLILLITGFYIFGVMVDFGVPLIFVMGFIALYTFLLIRSIMGFIRGI